MASQKQPLSLINPDLSGLWSTNHLGKENSTLSSIIGTIAISLFIYPWVLGFLMPPLIITLFYFQQYLIGIALISILIYPYIIHIEQWDFWQKFILKGCNYFYGGVSTSFQYKLDFTEPMLICLHPHGLFSLGAFYNGVRGRIGGNPHFSVTEKQAVWGEHIGTIPHIMQQLCGPGLIDSKLLLSPIFKHVCVGWLGGFASANKQSVIGLMKQKKSAYLIPGGFNEASLLKRNVDIVYIKNRKGFIKYALQYGVTVLVGYTFGECMTYNTWMSGESKLKAWLTNHHIPCVVPYGPYIWSGFLLPYRDTGLHTIYGKSKKFPRIEEPTCEDVEIYHKWYVEELQRVFNHNKWRFGMEDKELIVV